MRVRVGCQFRWSADAPVPMLMMVRPRPDADHIAMYESRWIRPSVPLREYFDLFGNYCWRFTALAGTTTVRYDAVMQLEPTPDPVQPEVQLIPPDELPDDVIVYTLPSRYVESDLLVPRAWEMFGDTAPTWARIQAICDFVHKHIEFGYGNSGPHKTALKTLEDGKGVCRDFALLAVAFCRAMNVPARYTFGYLPDIAVEPPDLPMDFHTWFEAYLGGRWYTFDARHNMPRIGRVVIGRGRDAVDVALTTAYGAARLDEFTVWADQVGDGEVSLPVVEEDADALEEAARHEAS